MLKEKKVKLQRYDYDRDKYDRSYVKKFYGKHLSFSKTSDVRYHKYDDSFYYKDYKLKSYIVRYLFKYIGKDIKQVYNDFSHLKWDSYKTMVYYWDLHVHRMNKIHKQKWGFYISDKQTLEYKDSHKRNELSLKDDSFTYEQLKWNETRIIPNLGKVYDTIMNGRQSMYNTSSTYKQNRYINDFFVLIDGKVVKLPIYHVPQLYLYGDNVNYNCNSRKGIYEHKVYEFINKTFIPITLYGTKMKKLACYSHYYSWVSIPEKKYNDNGDINFSYVWKYGDLGHGKLNLAVMSSHVDKALKR